MSAAGGLIETLAFPRFGLYPLAFFCLVPLFLATFRQTRGKAFLYGWIYGLALGLSSFSWLAGVMSGYGGLGPWGGALILFILAAFLALHQGIFVWLLNPTGLSRFPFLNMVQAAIYYSGVEYLKNWLFTGFNWTPIAGALAPAPKLLGLADVIGVYGLNFLVVLSAAAIASSLLAFFLDSGKKTVLWPLVVPLVTVATLLIYGTISYDVQEKKLESAYIKRVAVLQASVAQEFKWDSNYRSEILNRYRMLAREAATADPFLIIWSETAAPFVFGSDEYESNWVMALVDELGRPMLVGLTALAYDDDDGLYSTRNRAWLLYPKNRLGAYYDKRHLVPFGEYVPLVKLIPALKGPFFQGVLGAAGHFSSGDSLSIIFHDGIGFGPLICFESIFPYLARENVQAGADVLVVTTNDAWFGDSYAPDQHFNQSIMRAVENRRPLVRAANNGISGIILPSGRVTERSVHNDVQALIYDLPILSSPSTTLFTRGGYLVAPILAILTALVFFFKLFSALNKFRLRRQINRELKEQRSGKGLSPMLKLDLALDKKRQRRKKRK
jgi:apolipoprotein N-acyltransferase